ncbi:hypothetical protein V5R04_13650 [Jonesiaceae bacterium BS-20]|uniref:Lipoprotein n=1 Tax=Jonesiaceae bacterium BS-20 TaxID=3120821 RepID=A0AAU7DTH4_9MICO
MALMPNKSFSALLMSGLLAVSLSACTSEPTPTPQSREDACILVTGALAAYKDRSDDMIANGQDSDLELIDLMTTMQLDFEELSAELDNQEVKEAVDGWISAVDVFTGAIQTIYDNDLEMTAAEDIAVIEDLVGDIGQINMDMEDSADALDLACDGAFTEMQEN